MRWERIGEYKDQYELSKSKEKRKNIDTKQNKPYGDNFKTDSHWNFIRRQEEE